MKFSKNVTQCDKVLQLAAALGISRELAAQIIIFTTNARCSQHIAPKTLQSDQQRHDLLMALSTHLEDLEEQLEEEEEKEDEEKDK